MISESKVSARYVGSAGEEYSKKRQADPHGIGHQLNLKYFSPYLSPGHSVLDFGCGNGGMLNLISKTVQRADGLEVNPKSAEVARSLGLSVYSSIEELPATPTYDVIVSNHVLEHVRNPSLTLETLRKSLKSGGLFVVKLPLDDWRSKHQRTWSKHDVDHHLHTWTPRLLANLLFEAGFEVNELRVITSAWHPKLFPFAKFGLDQLAYNAFARLAKKRQLFAVGLVSNS